MAQRTHEAGRAALKQYNPVAIRQHVNAMESVVSPSCCRAPAHALGQRWPSAITEPHEHFAQHTNNDLDWSIQQTLKIRRPRSQKSDLSCCTRTSDRGSVPVARMQPCCTYKRPELRPTTPERWVRAYRSHCFYEGPKA